MHEKLSKMRIYKCSVTNCNNSLFARFEDFPEHGWSAWKIPHTGGQTKCFCPEHQIEMQEEVEKSLLKWRWLS
jgi:hypothetical protein